MTHRRPRYDILIAAYNPLLRWCCQPFLNSLDQHLSLIIDVVVLEHHIRFQHRREHRIAALTHEKWSVPHQTVTPGIDDGEKITRPSGMLDMGIHFVRDPEKLYHRLGGLPCTNGASVLG